MISVIVGVCLGYWVQRRKLGFVMSIVGGLIIGLWADNVALSDGAVFRVPVLTVMGLLLGWIIKWNRNRKAKVEG